MNIVPLEVYTGEDFYLPILYKYLYCGVEYPQDISGYAAKMDIRYTPKAVDPALITLSTANGGIIIDGPSGKIEIWIPKAQTILLPIYELVYDLRITNSMGMVERLFGGTFTVKEMVTT